ncbi:LXG domain-containing protein [Pseudalkalibacillus decolorationis]|uniref:LXG domain-containing protein n=1 Tax=Pseudalkalibacillus decolorationis TaxID=163879 RepID=UPI0021484651|nr:LXG domain-containing protein [Pseudalkalibacillus decolorationis]
MKVLKVSEVSSGIDLIIRKKEEEKEQLINILKAIKKVTDLEDALKGEGGNAIREHFMVVQTPALLLIKDFLENYIQQLNDIKGIVERYESNDGLVREDFIEQDVRNGITNVEQLTHDIVENINGQLNTVNDLVSVIPINTTQFDTSISNSKQHNQKTTNDLRSVDGNSTSTLESPANDLQEAKSFTGKIQGWTGNGIYLSKKELTEVGEALKPDTLEEMIEEYGLVTLLRNTTISFSGAIANSGKLLKTGDLSFKLFKKDGKIFIKIKGGEINNLHDYEKYRKLLKKHMGGTGKWSRQYVTGLVNDGVLLYDQRKSKRIKSSSNKFINSNFDDMGGYIKRLDEPAMKVAKDTFKGEMKVWESFKGWTDASKLTKFGKGAGILGIGLDVYDNARSSFYDENIGELSFSGKQTKEFLVDTTVDVGAGAAAMGAGAAAGSFFLPPAGTVVGAIVGAGVYAAVNVKFGDPPESIVDHTKKLANKAVDELGDCIESVGDKLDSIFW